MTPTCERLSDHVLDVPVVCCCRDLQVLPQVLRQPRGDLLPIRCHGASLLASSMGVEAFGDNWVNPLLLYASPSYPEHSRDQQQGDPMPPSDHDDSPHVGVGERLRRVRKRRRNLTQAGLAERSAVSRSYIAQIEAGHRIPSPAVTVALANGLRVDITELTGQPYRGTTPSGDRVHEMIPDVRRALTYIDLPPDFDIPPRSLDDLATEVEQLRQLSKAARHTQVGARLPALIEELTHHALEHGLSRAWGLLNGAQALAVSLCRRLGYNDLAFVAIERATASAARSEDPNLPHVARLSRALLMMTVGSWKPGLRLVQRASDGLDTTTTSGSAVAGALHLRAAVLSARASEAATAWEHHGLAVDAAHTLPAHSPDFYALQFGSANVAIHGCAVAVELEDHDEALRRDRALRLPPQLAAERRAHHEIDMARAHVEVGQPRRALDRILNAERVAPQMARYHPSAVNVITYLVDWHRTLPETLCGISSRMHIA